MSAQFAIEVLIYGGAIPAFVAFGTIYLMRHWLPETIAERYAMAAGLSLGFVAGYLLLPDWASLWPQRHWHWLPHLALMAMVAGPVGLARGVSIGERWLLWLAISVVAAWCLVPTWENLEPPRQFYVPVLAAYLFGLAALLEPLGKRFSPRVLLAELTLASACVAVVILVKLSLVYGQITGIATAASAGCFLASFYHWSTTMLRGSAAVFAILVGGLAFIGFVEPQKPLVGMLLLPAAPLALWTCTTGPFARLRGPAAVAVQTTAVLAALAIGAIWVFIG